MVAKTPPRGGSLLRHKAKTAISRLNSRLNSRLGVTCVGVVALTCALMHEQVSMLTAAMGMSGRTHESCVFNERDSHLVQRALCFRQQEGATASGALSLLASTPVILPLTHSFFITYPAVHFPQPLVLSFVIHFLSFFFLFLLYFIYYFRFSFIFLHFLSFFSVSRISFISFIILYFFPSLFLSFLLSALLSIFSPFLYLFLLFLLSFLSLLSSRVSLFPFFVFLLCLSSLSVFVHILSSLPSWFFSPFVLNVSHFCVHIYCLL